jgi:hypothetical protein
VNISTRADQSSDERSDQPSDAELAAILAAVELVWPRPVVVGGADVEESPRWRFSGRWWPTPGPSRRDRPF